MPHDPRNDALMASLLALIVYLIRTQQARDERIATQTQTQLATNLSAATEAVGRAVTMAVTEATRSVLAPTDPGPPPTSTLAYPEPYTPPEIAVFDPTDAAWPDMDMHLDTAIIPPGADITEFMGLQGGE